MKLYLGLLESSLPGQTRIFGELDGQLVDLQIAAPPFDSGRRQSGERLRTR
jgi:hypothetical protein